MLRYILLRIAAMVPTLLIISALVFTIIELPPGDYFESYVAELRAQGESVDTAEIKELRSEIAELRAVFRARPMTDEEVADPSTIPAGASFDFGDVDVDLEGLSEDDMKAWVLNYIDAQAIPPARRPGRKRKGEHERQA